ncbi:hypothetical protein E2562_018822 [Oryza meyeriana var. granulata]|uniref:Uncharacterized protein n=1 Tax=Oryza meyeriana var. granulata TaxID=110450 RepID=A0A6G1DAP1_9ORYZ|nr:hypothetical protein E2562_037025 [Oryza meyeriana var. granulata]KAF0933578.1 hypothetical protein E2562_018822 [Oryza meyeriana var. granulata]
MLPLVPCSFFALLACEQLLAESPGEACGAGRRARAGEKLPAGWTQGSSRQGVAAQGTPGSRATGTATRQQQPP